MKYIIFHEFTLNNQMIGYTSGSGRWQGADYNMRMIGPRGPMRDTSHHRDILTPSQRLARDLPL